MFKDMFIFLNKNKNIALILIGLIIILFSRYIRGFFGVDFGTNDINLLLDAIFGLALVMIGLLYKFKEVREDEDEL